MRVTMIAAMDREGLIGASGGLPPWRLPEDMAHFRRETMGKPVLMGRRTFASIGRPLKGRRNLVLSRQEGLTLEGAEVVGSVAEALERASGAEELMVIGGAVVYAALMARADRLLLTEVDGAFEGDTWFPEVDEARWREASRRVVEADERNSHRMIFRELVRR
ncbi:MAG: diacylglycerol kinase [Myxococcales bacterium]|nr:diacylglycerol kinase [Myxococcales bacterium]